MLKFSNTVLLIFLFAFNSYALASNLKLKIIYFHGNRRCEACVLNEENLDYSIRKNYKEEMKSGYIEFAVINFDEPENEHFIAEFDLEYPKAFICELEGKNEISRKELKNIWDYTYEYGKFEQYVVEEVNFYLFEKQE